MRRALVILFLATLVAGCRKSNPIVQPAPYTLYLKGNVWLYRGSGVVVSNSSGIKVTIKQTGQVQYTDSSGNYTFENVLPGTYDIEFDYSDYPPVKIPNYGVSYTDTVCQVTGSAEGNFGFGIGPTCTTVAQINSTLLRWVSYFHFFPPSTSDSEAFLVYFSPIATDTARTLSPFNLLFIGKNAEQVEYSKNDYNDPDWMAVYEPAGGLPFQIFSMTMSYLSSLGFAKGDSIYLRIYPLTTPTYYVDSTTGRKVFPSIGKGSNIIATVIPDTVSSTQTKFVRR